MLELPETPNMTKQILLALHARVLLSVSDPDSLRVLHVTNDERLGDGERPPIVR